MKITDLGRLEGPVVLWGGALGNLSALLALRDVTRDEGIAGANILFTGDLAGYCAEGEACADMVRRLGWRGIAGGCAIRGNIPRDAGAGATGVPFAAAPQARNWHCGAGAGPLFALSRLWLQGCPATA